MKAHLVRLWGRFLMVLAVVLALPACAARYTPQALHDAYPGADIVSVCTRTPRVKDGIRAWGENPSTRQTFTDAYPEAFDKFAQTAGTIFVYDPNAPPGSAKRLPWPYHNMECGTVSSWKTPQLPKGLPEIRISYELREALVSALIHRAPDPELRTRPMATTSADKRFLGQVVMTKGRPTLEAAQEIGQMFRDAIRGNLPTVSRKSADGLTDEQISVIDTTTGQILGGVGMGSADSFVPAGAPLSDAMIEAGLLPRPTRESMVGKGGAEVFLGLGQMVVGAGGAIGGGGATLTGGGAAVGVPVCIGGIALATNGAITFFNGGKTIILAICHWNELPAAADAQPLAAAQIKDPNPAPPAAPQTTPQSATPAAAAAPPSAAKPTSGNPPAQSAPPNQPTGQTAKLGHTQLGPGKQRTPNTREWVKCTGQVHHAISKTIYKALQDHKTLKNVYKERDSRFVTQAIDKAAHNGYETWHRNMEKKVVAWLKQEESATPAKFEAYLHDLYITDKELAARFPNGL